MSSRLGYGGQRYGFNFQWMYEGDGRPPEEADKKALSFLAEHGFNFARIPCNYRFWTRDFDYLRPDEMVLRYLDRYLDTCRSYGIHLCLNLHRAPGYCINRNDTERHNLWLDVEAQEGFLSLWIHFAERYKGVPASDLSFDLVNEPPAEGQYGMTRAIHSKLMRRAFAGIRGIDPQRPVVIDGLDGGNLAMPELADIDLVQSCRGYQPMTVTHYGADWWSGSAGMSVPEYPGGEWDGKIWNRDRIVEFYEPWVSLQRLGVEVHVGEFGCYDRTPNEVALRWFRDLFSVFGEFGWGFSLWGFEGPFGIIDHGRPGAKWEQMSGYRVDREMLELMIEARQTTGVPA